MKKNLALHIRKSLGAFYSRASQLEMEREQAMEAMAHCDFVGWMNARNRISVEQATSLDELEAATGFTARFLYEMVSDCSYPYAHYEPSSTDLLEAIDGSGMFDNA